MQAAAAKPIIDQLRGAGLSLTVKPDGRLTVSPSTNLTDDLRELIRANKPMLMDWLRATTPDAANDPDASTQPGTQRPDDLPPTLLAASQSLDAQIVAAGLPLTPPEQAKPKLATVNKQVDPKVDTFPPKPPKVKHIDREWKPLATAYFKHHAHCAACIAAGLNPRYQRCGTGAMLWSLYQAAIE
jgi:hypothetical protein